MISRPPSDPQIFHGDCLELLKQIPDDSIDASVTDPPYGMSRIDTKHVVAALTAWLKGEPYLTKSKGFMAKTWDGFVPGPEIWRELYRVLKPGAYALVFASSRTQDLMGISLRLAGFEIRDEIMWIQGQGFPKSLDVSKGIDTKLGNKRPVVGKKRGVTGENLNDVVHGSEVRDATDPGGKGVGAYGVGAKQRSVELDVTAPVSEEAKRYAGYGTALKPSYEPIIVARKPLRGTVPENVLTYGTGALDIDGCRVPHAGAADLEKHSEHVARLKEKGGTMKNNWKCSSDLSGANDVTDLGRFPPNVVLTHADGCRVVGHIRVKGDPRGAGTGTRPGGFAEPLAYKGESAPNAMVYGDEMCPVYECAEGCPVAEMDRQAGVKRSGLMKAGTPRPIGPGVCYGKAEGVAVSSDTRADEGSVTRFFPIFRREELNFATTLGRFPPNVALTHAPGCRHVGMVEVKAAPTWDTPNRQCESGFTGEITSPVKHGGDSEIVEQWECVAGCPVAEMELQSGGGAVYRYFPTFAREGSNSGAGRTPIASISPQSFPVEADPGLRYVPKTSRVEREAGCTHLPKKQAGEATGGRKEGSAGLDNPRAGASRGEGAHNFHPTVKPEDLMRWLVRLVTFPGAVVLDLFMGSGSTGVACVKEKRGFIGFEQDAGYVDIAIARIDHAVKIMAVTSEFRMPNLDELCRSSPQE